MMTSNKIKHYLINLIKNDKGSAYAWLVFFVFIFAFATAWYFALEPIWKYAIDVAIENDYVSLPGANFIYIFFANILPYFPFLVFILALMAHLKYASTTKREGW